MKPHAGNPKKSLSTKAKSQCARLLAYLTAHANGATTLEITKKLDVLRPGARICELRQQGHNIMTHWTVEDTPLGTHKVARYTLLTY